MLTGLSTKNILSQSKTNIKSTKSDLTTNKSLSKTLHLKTISYRLSAT